jgi:hypothetical protein
MTEAVHGQGVQLRVGADTAAVTATVLLGGLTNTPPPPFSRGFIDVTSHDSPQGYREFIPDLKDPGEMSCTLNWTGNATDDVLLAMTTEEAPRLFEITYPQVTPNRLCTFQALLTSYEPTGEVDGGQLTATIGLRVTGVPVWSDAA